MNNECSRPNDCFGLAEYSIGLFSEFGRPTGEGKGVFSHVPWLLLLSVVLLLWGHGCAPTEQVPIPPPQSMEETVQAYNLNVAQIKPLKARIEEWTLRFKDDQDEWREFHERGTRFYYRPASERGAHPCLYLRASAPFESQAWVVGANERFYWMYSKTIEQGWWGRHSQAGRPCAGEMPFGHPEVFLEMAGLQPIPWETLPAAQRGYAVRAEESVFSCQVVEDGRVRSRHYVFDRRSNLPTEIHLTVDGEPLLVSQLGDYQTVGQAQVPGSIRIGSVDGESFLWLKLGGFAVDTDPHERLFTRPERIPGVKDYEQLDKQCE